MTGKKLHQLLQEITPSQRRELITLCNTQTDKRHLVLGKILQSPNDDLVTMNDRLRTEIEQIWPQSGSSEKAVKQRRMQHFFCTLLEQQLLLSLLQNNSSIRNVLLAQVLQKSGNGYLLNHYYDQAYKKSVEEEDSLFQLIGIKGKIRMKYMAQGEKELEEALALNNEFLHVLHNVNEQKIAEYYEHASNVYLEHQSIVEESRDRYITEIRQQLTLLTHPLNRASLYVSLAKFHYNQPELPEYFNEARKILDAVTIHSNDFLVIERKSRFLELRFRFFHGESLETLVQLADDILSHSNGFSVMNNNTLFYKILFELLQGHTEKAENLLDQNQVYFKGDGKVPEHFLRALLHIYQQEYRKAHNLLQPIMHGSNYFFAIFSRLLVIKLQLLRGQGAWSKSTVDSTRRYLRLNSGNPLGQEANLYVLNQLARIRSGRKVSETEKTPVLTALHRFILSGQ